MHDHDDDDDDLPRLDMEAVNHAVAKQDFTMLNKMLIHTDNAGADIILLLAMCTMLHTQVKALREEVGELRKGINPKQLDDPGYGHGV